MIRFGANWVICLIVVSFWGIAECNGQNDLLVPKRLLQAESFWDNRDWNWYEANIPFFECPDSELQTTYYYRWELLTKHLTYGSVNSGYAFTEFIDRPFWSGAFGAISCPAGHQLYEARWLRNPVYARDFSAYWLRTPGSQPRNYSTWLADAIWAVHQVHPDSDWIVGLLPELKTNYRGWEQKHFVPDVGLFWQTGHDDGMEYNINSRQTEDIVRGAPGFRPTLNSYLYADALAISRIAELSGERELADEFRRKASSLKSLVQEKLWDPRRKFFFHMALRDESADGFTVKAGTLTHQTGRNAGSLHGRELIGFVPWQFSLPESNRGYEVAWEKLFDPEAFQAPFGPRTVELHDPMFALKPSCCWWSGQSWPYATSQTLKALANLLQEYPRSPVSAEEYLQLLQTFSRTHRKEGQPYLAEACHPETGSFSGHDSNNHSEHYFHSSFNDLIITGLVGLRPSTTDILEVHPLAPESWDYFALDRVPFRGHEIGIAWDRTGARYGRGSGLMVFVDGQEAARSSSIVPLKVKLTAKSSDVSSGTKLVNYAVNNEGDYFPRVTASHTNERTPLFKLVDGNYWYHRNPPNRWTCEDSPNLMDEIVIDFGIERPFELVKLYFLDDRSGVTPPKSYALEFWQVDRWVAPMDLQREPAEPTGRCANCVGFRELKSSRVRIQLTHSENGKAGLSEIECWGRGQLPVRAAPHPPGNLARRLGGEFPKASASHSDRFGGKPELAIDGKINYLPTPLNRWTSFESASESDWLAIDFGEPKEFNRIELAIYDDRGGVLAPERFSIQTWDGTDWRAVPDALHSPQRPTGNQLNVITFPRVTSGKIRVVFEHSAGAKSGISEILIWNDSDTEK